MMDRGGSGGGDGSLQSMKPERPNSLGPKISKRINFYHSDNCKLVVTQFLVDPQSLISFLLLRSQFKIIKREILKAHRNSINSNSIISSSNNNSSSNSNNNNSSSRTVS